MPSEWIERPDDPRIAEYRAISDGALKRAQGLFVAEGRLVVQRLIEGRRFRVHSLLLTETALASLDESGVPVREAAPVFLASKPLMREITGFAFHQGCLALAERPSQEPRLPIAIQGARRIVVLEGVTHADNVGAMFRSAAAFGCDAVLLDAACADPLYREAIRVSMAATLQVPFARAESWPSDLDRLRETGFRVVALTPSSGALPISAVARSTRMALMAGSEGTGLTEAALARADLAARIPIAPGVDSLNVAAATAIALHVLFGPAADGPGQI